MKIFFMVILTLFLGINVFATAQYPDKIIYKGKEYDIFSNPLETYFEKYPDKRPKDGINSSALWRRYVATFEIKNKQVFVKDIEIQHSNSVIDESHSANWRSVLNEVFPDKKNIKADWLNELIIIPHGKLVNYVHSGYSSVYSKYLLLEINKGDLKKEKNFNYKEYEKFKEKQFLIFKKTEEYKKLKVDLQKDGYSDEFIDSFLRKFAIQYTSKIITK